MDLSKDEKRFLLQSKLKDIHAAIYARTIDVRVARGIEDKGMEESAVKALANMEKAKDIVEAEIAAVEIV